MRTWQVRGLQGASRVLPDWCWGVFICPSPCLVPAGVRTNLLTLQPALRTLTHDYNSLKRQVRDFPLLLQETLRSARAEVRPPGPPPSTPPCGMEVLESC